MSALESTFQDNIASLCFKQFESLAKTGKPQSNQWTILSCIVLENENKFKVVALGTGTRCIGYDKMSKSGDILHDSHAEVICRRTFLRYIYEQMLLPGNSIFTFNPEKLLFQVNSTVKFHFFTSHVPCGDAAIFPKQDVDYFGNLIVEHTSKRVKSSIVNSVNKKLKVNKNNDIFRTGAKCLESDVNQDLKLEGPNYHITGVVRTKPGRGTPTLSVSCSDKIAKWCHLGVQGALLFMLLDKPIYLSSVTIAGGTPYNDKALKRALCSRLESVDLETFYKSEIVLGQSNLPFVHAKLEGKRPCPTSISWINVDNIDRQTEIVVNGKRQGVTKKHSKSSEALKICKVELFRKFILISKQFKTTYSCTVDLNEITYREAKMLSKEYQKYWALLKNSFKVWTTKHESLDNFFVS